MQLPEFVYSIGFWFKFIPLFGLFVVVPVFYLDFTDSLGWKFKILFLLGGGLGLMFALNGKTLKYGKNKQYQR